MVNEIRCIATSQSIAFSKDIKGYPLDGIVLNSASFQATPSLGTFLLHRKQIELPLYCSFATNNTFVYDEDTFLTMMLDAKLFLSNQCDGILFSFYTSNHHIDIERTKAMTQLIHHYNKEAIFLLNDSIETTHIQQLSMCDTIVYPIHSLKDVQHYNSLNTINMCPIIDTNTRNYQEYIKQLHTTSFIFHVHKEETLHLCLQEVNQISYLQNKTNTHDSSDFSIF